MQIFNPPPPTASLQTASANPATTTSTTGVMMGLAGSITPSASGKLNISVTGDMDNNTDASGCAVVIRYGTGAAPANGAALTGTAVASTPIMTEGDATGLLVGYVLPRFPFSLSAVVTGTTIGTAYWIDISLAAVTSGTARVRNVSIAANEFST